MKNIFIITLLLSSYLFSNDWDGNPCSIPDSPIGAGFIHLAEDGSVLYKSPESIGGFQFNTGVEIISSSGGDAAEAGFTIQNMGDLLLAFSLTGATIPEGCGTLTVLELDGEANELFSIVVSNAVGQEIYFEYFDGIIESEPYCGDDECNGDETVNSCPEDCNTWDGDPCSIPDSPIGAGFIHLAEDGSVLYKSPESIGGFQFNTGVEIISSSGGDAAEAGFTIQNMGDLLLAFSLTGATIPEGCGTLTVLELDGEANELFSIVVSNAVGQEIYFEYFDGILGADIEGCTDPSACNYNGDATLDDGSCDYSEENFDCDNNCIVDIDCNGVCGGGTILDECGICGGDGIADGECDCDGNVDLGCGCGEAGPSGCDNTCGSTLEFDECGICDGNGIAEGTCDCEGEIVDDPPVCNPGFTAAGIEIDNQDDCEQTYGGIWEGYLSFYGNSCENLVDALGCEGILPMYWNIPVSQICPATCDCLYVEGCTDPLACNYSSSAITDDGSCEYPEENFDCNGNCIVNVDCNDECGGNATEDACGVCEGNGIEQECGCGAADQFGLPEGACDCDGNILDECGVCDGDNSSCTIEGCWESEDACNYLGPCPLEGTICINNEESCWYATEGCECTNGEGAVIDECGVCGGDGPEEGFDCDGNCIVDIDCNGVCGGGTILDECGVCGGNGAEEGFDCDGNCIVDIDCNEVCGGTTELDECGVCGGDGSSCEEIECIEGWDENPCTMPALGVGALHLTSSGELFYTSSEAIGGFQFSTNGINILDIFGGAAEEAQFNLSSNGDFLLGFSLTGSTIPAGCGILTQLVLDGTPNGLNDDFIISSSSGTEHYFEYFDGEINDGPYCGDGTCDSFENSESCPQDCLFGFYCDSDLIWDENPCTMPALGIGALHLTSSGELLYTSSEAIGGFQFSTNGINILDIFGGAAEEAQFNLSSNGDFLLGFSLTGSTIPAGCGILTQLVLDGTPNGLNDDFIISSSSGTEHYFEYFDGSLFTDACCGDGSCDTVEDECSCKPDCLPNGCMDIDACNYDPEAGWDDGSCIYIQDCFGVCGGGAVEDECGVCNGDGIPEGKCDCEGNLDLGCGCGETGPSGCDNECGSTAVLDECGVCEGDGIPEGECDCDGNVEDCAGVCGGDSVEDECGVCDGAGIPAGDCDCDGNRPETSFLDCDGNCINDEDGDGTCDELSIFESIIPDNFTIQNIYPNPFNPVTNIEFGLPKNGIVEVSIYDINGRELETLVNGFKLAGYYSIMWDATNYSSGIYLVVMLSENFKETRQIILMK